MGRQDSTEVTQFVQGLDVSHHQGEVHWRDIALAGNVFAYVKATEGIEFVDSRFSVNWMEMKDAGIIRGAYRFFRPSAPVEAQVKGFLTTIGTLAIDDLPPVLDLEAANTSADRDEWEALPVEQRMPLALEWLRGVEQAASRKPIIYTRRGFVKRCFGSAGGLSDYPLLDRSLYGCVETCRPSRLDRLDDLAVFQPWPSEGNQLRGRYGQVQWFA